MMSSHELFFKKIYLQHLSIIFLCYKKLIRPVKKHGQLSSATPIEL